MKYKGSAWKSIPTGFAMLVIILDGRTAISSIQDGIQLCLQTVIPALFPFFILSGIINSSLLGKTMKFLWPIRILCRIPKGAESLFVIGCISGYPVGAQLIAQAYHEEKIDRFTADRMLGFCNNAGPAFIFGMLSPLFQNPFIPWVLWGIHITGALFTGFLLPGGKSTDCQITPTKSISLVESLQRALKSIATVCGWVMVFRLLIGFCQRWFLWLFPMEAQVLFTGLLELSNGCMLLSKLPTEGIRFILASILLSLGGICVGMQTQSVTQRLGSGYYFPGKVLQALVCTFLSCVLQKIIFPKTEIITVSPVIAGSVLCITVLFAYLLRGKKVVAFKRKMVYNTVK